MSKRAIIRAVVALLGLGLLVGCPSSEANSSDTVSSGSETSVADLLSDGETNDLTEPDAEVASDSGSDQGADSGVDLDVAVETSLPVNCGGQEPSFPSFNKGCNSQDDCALVFHTVNCCGTNVAWGIHGDEVAAFDIAEATCDSQYPGCGCAQDMTEAEDGQRSHDPEAFAVACISGTCRSLIPRSCEEIATAYFEEASTLDYCTAPDQCERRNSGLCVNAMGCMGLIMNKDADLTKLDALLAESVAMGCPVLDDTCECPNMEIASFGCHDNRCYACETACTMDCECKRDWAGCPINECVPEGCEEVLTGLAEAASDTGSCATNADCQLLELGPICGSMACQQLAVSTSLSDEQMNTFYELGGQGMQLGCEGFTCGCDALGSPLCIDQGCRLCPGDCDGSCDSLRRAAQELAADHRDCYGPGECVVPDLCTTCGTPVRFNVAGGDLFFLGLALQEACGDCDDWCSLAPLDYHAACVSGVCERLDGADACGDLEARVATLLADPASRACAADAECAALEPPGEPFCTGGCGCAVIANKLGAHHAGVLMNEHQLLGCPSAPCACDGCVPQVACVDGFCQ